ncbi:hypothetical protein [Veronia pacifica]|uniref:Uncharacterized protein n=1 Tax=Veronia pacifica TaxID=1080227 RepID=A0A1C3EK81_9GAMM|nr:hypothetical protein [Veronia pacifica]ODA33635.1 hypothetical protein A8L45_09650 [Veronia pacifica]
MAVLSSLSFRSLLLLRLALDANEYGCDIEQDIMDLYLFPERLAESYPDEWRSYIKRGLARLKIKESSVAAMLSDQPHTLNDDEEKLLEKIRNAKPQFDRLIAVVDEAQRAQHADNVSALQTPLHRWLEWAIS